MRQIPEWEYRYYQVIEGFAFFTAGRLAGIHGETKMVAMVIGSMAGIAALRFIYEKLGQRKQENKK